MRTTSIALDEAIGLVGAAATSTMPAVRSIAGARMMPGTQSVFLLMNDLDSLGGSSQLMCTLALQLQRAGHAVSVYTEYAPAPDNRYARLLDDAHIPVNAEVGDLAAVRTVPALLLPARFVVALGGMLLSRASFAYSWRRTGERLNRFLLHRRFSRRARRAFSAAVAAERRNHRAVLVHVHRGAALVRWANAVKAPVVYVENSTPTPSVGIDWWFAADPSHGSNAAKGWRRLRRVVHRVDLLIAGSQRAAQGLREQLRYHGPIATLPWMVDTAAASAHRVRSRPTPPLVVGTAGRLEKEKGHAFLIQAMSRVLQVIPARFVVAGDGSLRAELEQLAAQLRVRQHIEFLGAQDDAGMERFWDAIDLFVLPSLLEGSPLVVLEAMARRIPVVATDVGGVNELLDDGRCGRVVAAGAPTALADAIIELATNVAQRDALAQAGYDRFIGEHAPDAALPAWLQAYARVLENASGQWSQRRRRLWSLLVARTLRRSIPVPSR